MILQQADSWLSAIIQHQLVNCWQQQKSKRGQHQRRKGIVPANANNKNKMHITPSKSSIKKDYCTAWDAPGDIFWFGSIKHTPTMPLGRAVPWRNCSRAKFDGINPSAKAYEKQSDNLQQKQIQYIFITIWYNMPFSTANRAVEATWCNFFWLLCRCWWDEPRAHATKKGKCI